MQRDNIEVTVKWKDAFSLKKLCNSCEYSRSIFAERIINLCCELCGCKNALFVCASSVGGRTRTIFAGLLCYSYEIGRAHV